jgi:hypothetical protein
MGCVKWMSKARLVFTAVVVEGRSQSAGYFERSSGFPKCVSALELAV